jgi:hypothetical protein
MLCEPVYSMGQMNALEAVLGRAYLVQWMQCSLLVMMRSRWPSQEEAFHWPIMLF